MVVIIETDFLEVAHLANDRNSSKKEITWTIAEIQGSKSNFQSIEVQHVPRLCNNFAHFLAKKALNDANTTYMAGQLSSGCTVFSLLFLMKESFLLKKREKIL